MLEARLQLLPDVPSDEQGDEGADLNCGELRGHPVKAFVYLAWVESVGELFVDLTGDVLQVRVDL